MSHPTKHATLNLFWSKKEIRPSGCWIWSGMKNWGGYGQFRSRHFQETQAHRISWEVIFGPIPEGKLVCHHCDTRLCINPDHLFLGTFKDNTLDAINKGRFSRHIKNARHGHWEGKNVAKGERHGTAKLTDEQVTRIRQLHRSGMTYYRLSKAFKIDETHIGRICKGLLWKHVQ